MPMSWKILRASMLHALHTTVGTSFVRQMTQSQILVEVATRVTRHLRILLLEVEVHPAQSRRQMHRNWIDLAVLHLRHRNTHTMMRPKILWSLQLSLWSIASEKEDTMQRSDHVCPQTLNVFKTR